MITLSNLLTFATLASTQVVLAADTTCNPLTSSNCSPDTALSTSFSEDFTQESKSQWFSKESHQGNVSFDSSNGLGLSLAKQGDNPTFTSNFYIMYGKVSVIMKAAPGQGVVSSFYLQSDDLDELDLEWLGGDNTQFQSDYFSQGKTITYDRGAFHGVDDPTGQFHTYTIDWAMDQTTWSLDGTVVRSLPNTTAEGYPQTPMYIKFGIWAGGDPSNQPGTIEWAGGLTDYTQGPYTMYIKDVIVTDYSSGETYSYDGTSGSWESIQAKNGQVYGRYAKGQQEFDDLAQGKEISSDRQVSSSAALSSSTTSIQTSSTAITSNVQASSTKIVSSSKIVSSKIVSSKIASSSSKIVQKTSSVKKSVQPTTTSTSIPTSTEVATISSSTETAPTTSTLAPKKTTTIAPKETATTQSDKKVSTTSAVSSTHSVKVKSADIAAALPKPILAICIVIGSFLI